MSKYMTFLFFALCIGLSAILRGSMWRACPATGVRPYSLRR